MSTRSKIIIAVAVASIALALRLFVGTSSSPRIVGRTTTPDGVELCVVQESSPGEFPPFNTSFVFHKPGTNWGWFYYDHEDRFWGRARISLNTNANLATVYRGARPTITFDWSTETYRVDKSDLRRTLIGAQRHMPKAWSPERSVYDER